MRHPLRSLRSASLGLVGLGVLATSSQAQTDTPTNAVWADAGVSGFASTADGAMHPSSVSSFGGGQAHDNMQPFQVVNYIIALQGLFPSRN